LSVNIDDLEHRAAANDCAAQVMLAHRHQNSGRHDLARGWFARAAKGGDVAALRLLAVSLLAQAPMNIGEGMGMIRTAAERGDGEAALLCAAFAGQDSALADNWTIALDYLARAARSGSPQAKAQQRLLMSGGPQIDLTRWLSPAPARALSDAPRIAVAEGFATPEECDFLIARARPELREAEVYDPRGGGGFRASGIRSNSAASFGPVQSDLVMALLRARMARWTGLATEAMEPMSVLHYATGEQFAPHFDFIDPLNRQLADDLAQKGQRQATVLVYLNDDFEGGETEFCDLDLRHRGRKGDALLFWNVTPEGLPDRRTRHAGLPPARGEKWLLSQWIRGR